MHKTVDRHSSLLLCLFLYNFLSCDTMKANSLQNLNLAKACDYMIFLGSIFLLIAGVLMLCFPDVVYSITESWKSNASGEPSGLYKLHIRIGGIACSLVGIAGMIANFVL